MRISENLLIRGQEQQVLQTRSCGEDTIRGIRMKGSRQRIGFFHNVQANGGNFPAIFRNGGPQPGFPVHGKFNAAPFLEAGNLGGITDPVKSSRISTPVCFAHPTRVRCRFVADATERGVICATGRLRLLIYTVPPAITSSTTREKCVFASLTFIVFMVRN